MINGKVISNPIIYQSMSKINSAVILFILSDICLYCLFKLPISGAYLLYGSFILPTLTIIAGIIQLIRKVGSKILTIIAITGGSLILLFMICLIFGMAKIGC